MGQTVRKNRRHIHTCLVKHSSSCAESKFYEIQSYIKYMRLNSLCDMCIYTNLKVQQLHKS
jgi:hypothetical protein